MVNHAMATKIADRVNTKKKSINIDKKDQNVQNIQFYKTRRAILLPVYSTIIIN